MIRYLYRYVYRANDVFTHRANVDQSNWTITVIKMFIEQMTCYVIDQLTYRAEMAYRANVLIYGAIEQMVNRSNGTRANDHRANGIRADVVAPFLWITNKQTPYIINEQTPCIINKHPPWIKNKHTSHGKQTNTIDN